MAGERPDKELEEDYGNPNYNAVSKKTSGGSSDDSKQNTPNSNAKSVNLRAVKADADNGLDFVEKNGYNDMLFGTPKFWFILQDNSKILATQKTEGVAMDLQMATNLVRYWQSFLIDDQDFLQKLTTTASPELKTSITEPRSKIPMLNNLDMSIPNRQGGAQSVKSNSYKEAENEFLPPQRKGIDDKGMIINRADKKALDYAQGYEYFIKTPSAQKFMKKIGRAHV